VRSRFPEPHRSQKSKLKASTALVPDPSVEPERHAEPDRGPPDDESFRKLYWTPAEFAQQVDRTEPTIWKWWREGSGPPWVLLGRRRVIPKQAAREWLSARLVTPPRSFQLCSPARHRS
jgi:hypothetical protein